MTQTPLDRSVRRARRLIIAFAAYLFVVGTAFAFDSNEGRAFAARFSAWVRGYDGCMCEGCRYHYLRIGVENDPVLVVARLLEIPMWALGAMLGGGYVNQWIVGRTMLACSLPVLVFGLRSRQTLYRIAASFARDPNLCIGCNYDLRGLPTSAVCPECGKPRT